MAPPPVKRGLTVSVCCAQEVNLSLQDFSEEVNAGRAGLISIMYFALFIQEQLKKEVGTMKEDWSRRGWGGTHKHERHVN